MCNGGWYLALNVQWKQWQTLLDVCREFTAVVWVSYNWKSSRVLPPRNRSIGWLGVGHDLVASWHDMVTVSGTEMSRVYHQSAPVTLKCSFLHSLSNCTDKALSCYVLEVAKSWSMFRRSPSSHGNSRESSDLVDFTLIRAALRSFASSVSKEIPTGDLVNIA